MSSRSTTFAVLLCYYDVLAGFTIERDCSTVRIRCSCSDGICCGGHHGADTPAVATTFPENRKRRH
ncbi:hypothetical protein PF008_g2644 [Phytophthora fragariae]|uniref:Secreted protein n=1 Tax=Phytophthora fragariae TaxID=53985 RepID=A0A6G0SGJ5_9STRA|nr:hypothetical protein PF008_g2644 [Phytophthora fragariae]